MQTPSLGRVFPIRPRTTPDIPQQTQIEQLKSQVVVLQAALDALTVRVTTLENA
jgi:hypothetical protein